MPPPSILSRKQQQSMYALLFGFTACRPEPKLQWFPVPSQIPGTRVWMYRENSKVLTKVSWMAAEKLRDPERKDFFECWFHSPPALCPFMYRRYNIEAYILLENKMNESFKYYKNQAQKGLDSCRLLLITIADIIRWWTALPFVRGKCGDSAVR